MGIGVIYQCNSFLIITPNLPYVLTLCLLVFVMILSICLCAWGMPPGTCRSERVNEMMNNPPDVSTVQDLSLITERGATKLENHGSDTLCPPPPPPLQNSVKLFISPPPLWCGRNLLRHPPSPSVWPNLKLDLPSPLSVIKIIRNTIFLNKIKLTRIIQPLWLIG